jgi:membrane protease YdiL (CAAX protease family)
VSSGGSGSQLTVSAPRAAVLAAAAGCAVLTARPLLLGVAAGAGPGPVLATLFLVLLGVSLGWPATGRPAPATRVAPVLAIGIGAFAVGRLLAAASPGLPDVTAPVVALNTLAAVAEEAFFRRLVYGALLPGGPVLAVAGSALLFAAVHVTVYGPWVLPLDLAAGLLLAWQRHATGSWAVPTLTHAVANLLVVF